MPPIPTLNIPQGDTDTGPLLPIIDTHSLVSLREGLIRCNSDQYALKHVLVYQFQLSRWDIDTEPYFQGSLTLDGLRTTLLQTFREYFDSSLSELEAQNQSKQKMLEASVRYIIQVHSTPVTLTCHTGHRSRRAAIAPGAECLRVFLSCIQPARFIY